jgi:CxxC-x17-CxxC domain-containing protein
MGRFERSEGGSSRGRSGSRDRFSRGGRDFDDRRDSGSRFGGRRAKPEMHDVICDKCGKECQVPFKPSSSKPVYCSECFEKNDSPRGNSGSSSKDLEQINQKLDKIMQALEIE